MHSKYNSIIGSVAIVCLHALFVAKPALAKDGHGLDLDHPGLIDAVASVLYPYQDQESFTRVDDDTVIVDLGRSFVLQLQRMPGRDCAFQVRRLNEEHSAINQYDFSRLTGEYRVVNSVGGLSNSIVFEGETAWCTKDKNGVSCWNLIQVTVGGPNDSRKVMRAMAYLQRNFCAPAKPRRPF